MPYKDDDKQREAVRQATRRYRQRLKTIADRECGITQEDNAVIPVIPYEEFPVIPKRTSTTTVPSGPTTTVKSSPSKPEPQSYNSMMVGYVPLKG